MTGETDGKRKVESARNTDLALNPFKRNKLLKADQRANAPTFGGSTPSMSSDIGSTSSYDQVEQMLSSQEAQGKTSIHDNDKEEKRSGETRETRGVDVIQEEMDLDHVEETNLREGGTQKVSDRGEKERKEDDRVATKKKNLEENNADGGEGKEDGSGKRKLSNITNVNRRRTPSPPAPLDPNPYLIRDVIMSYSCIERPPRPVDREFIDAD
nr:uncharacterized protein CI109_001164 [Kwoniella shandongensis]KAA5530363.1 hypothetical protein CI109_001164 [Kwoniella shandongensis]